MPNRNTVKITIYGFENRQKTVPVTDSHTLADVREWISKELTLEEVKRLLVGDAQGARARQIPGFVFHDQDDNRISFNQEREQIAISFGRNSNKRLLIKAHQQDQSQGFLWVFSLAVLGWTPPVWFSIKNLKTDLKKVSSTTKEKAKALGIAIVFLLIFLLDFSDAVVDLLIFFQDLMEGMEGDRVYGILLGVMTILARLLAGWYGVAHNRISSSDYYDDKVEQLLISTYFFVELSVFMMEDGASILYLVHTDREDDILTKMNMILTSICGICFVCYNMFNVGKIYQPLTISVTNTQLFLGGTQRSISTGKNAKCKSGFIYILSLIIFTLAILMVVLLIQGVWRDDPTFLEFEKWNIIYGVGVGLVFLLSVSLIRSFDAFQEFTLAQRDMLQEYREAFMDPEAKEIPPGVEMTFTTTTGFAPSHDQIVRENYPFGW